ncbi:class I SAM-dependent methyltransferase [Rhodococcus spongiicola]|uniref:Methyltransferase domain-containing protein n=1 Tax=Rhodococcus spongiicola TaxID=2487352 RepID=A0A3S3E6X1_9NOCA|nr:methyltransferase [Rhodococcus spongiicola]RVW06738.1 methyltransferase domain-containing protein [Rhodococcus spongiicola]
MLSVEDVFSRIRRFPDVEAPNLFAVDAADRLILDEAAGALGNAPTGTVVVIGDHYGALTLGCAVRFGAKDIRVQQDRLTGERALANNAEAVGQSGSYRSLPLGEDLLAGARVVLMQLPRGLDELDEIADAVARYAAPDVVVYAGGRNKHITHAMNDVLRLSFENVRATLGRQKSRVLIADSPLQLAESSRFPVVERLDDLDLHVVAHGAVFAGPKLDIGTRFLLEFLPGMREAETAVDLGCGTGILAVSLAKAQPSASVIASDQSAAAVASAAATARANGVGDRVRALRDDALDSLPDASVDLIVCNPPFHVGAAVHTGSAAKMFAAAGRVLRSGGELWIVFNSHLGYKGALGRAVGPTEEMGRSAKFTVTRSTRVR